MTIVDAPLTSQQQSVSGGRVAPRHWPAYVLLAGLTVLAHFCLARSFGLYEDDYFFYGRAIALDAAGVWDWITRVLGYWPQGRPVGFILAVAAAWAAHAVAGLLAIYAVGCAVIVLNGCLLYRLIGRPVDGHVGLLAAALFILLPADTTKPLLTHSLILQPSLTFTLAALLLWTGRSKRARIAAYPLAALSLLTYESAFLLFCLAPLWSWPWDRSTLRRLVGHGAVCGLLVAASLVVRLAYDEPRLVGLEATGTSLATRVLASFAVGPAAVLWQSACGFLGDLQNWGPGEGAVVLIGGLLALPLIAGAVLWRRRCADSTVARRAWPAVWIALPLLPAAYAFSFTHYPPTTRWGVGTSVHLAASVPAALLLAGLWMMLLNCARWAWLRASLAAALAVFLASMVAYGVVIQRGFVKAFEEQRAFWSQVIAACPDMTPETMVLIVGRWPSPSLFAHHAAAETPMVPRLLFDWPGELLPAWQQRLRPVAVLIRSVEELAGSLGRDERGLYWAVRPHWTIAREERLPEDLIVLEAGLRDVRRVESLSAGPYRLVSKPLGAPSLPAATLPLYDLLIDRTMQMDAGPFEGIDGVEGLSAASGPHPQYGLPVVRSAANGPVVIPASGPRKVAIVVDASSTLPRQRLVVRLNGRRIAAEDIPQWRFRRFVVPLTLPPGQSTIEIVPTRTERTRPWLVHYAKLQMLAME